MADYYTTFSERIDDLTDVEVAFIRKDLEPDEEAEKRKCRLYKTEEWPGFRWEIHTEAGERPHLWINGEDGGDLENIAQFVRSFLKAFRPSTALTNCLSSFGRGRGAVAPLSCPFSE